MYPFIAKILIDVARKRLKTKEDSAPITKKQIEPLVKSMHVELTHAIQDYIFIIIGVFSAGFGLKGFLLPNQFIDGGATGISLLLKNITTIDLSIFIGLS